MMLISPGAKEKYRHGHTMCFAIKHDIPSCLLNHYYSTLLLFPGKHNKNEHKVDLSMNPGKTQR